VPDTLLLFRPRPAVHGAAAVCLNRLPPPVYAHVVPPPPRAGLRALDGSRHLLIFGFMLLYLFTMHLFRMYHDYMGWTLDITGPLMLLTIKVGRAVLWGRVHGWGGGGALRQPSTGTRLVSVPLLHPTGAAPFTKLPSSSPSSHRRPRLSAVQLTSLGYNYYDGVTKPNPPKDGAKPYEVKLYQDRQVRAPGGLHVATRLGALPPCAAQPKFCML
jgi:hypothetical protein